MRRRVRYAARHCASLCEGPGRARARFALCAGARRAPCAAGRTAVIII